MYKDNETLITTEDLGKEGSPNFLKKGSKVTFVKVAGGGLEDSQLVVKVGDRPMVVKETSVRIKSWYRRMKAIYDFNKQMVEGYPRLRMYNGFFFQKWFWKAYYFFADRFQKEKVDELKSNSLDKFMRKEHREEGNE